MTMEAIICRQIMFEWQLQVPGILDQSHDESARIKCIEFKFTYILLYAIDHLKKKNRRQGFNSKLVVAHQSFPEYYNIIYVY